MRTGRAGPPASSSAGPRVLALSIGLAAVDVAPELAVRPWLARNPDAPVGVEIPRRYHLWHLNAWQLLSPTALGGPSDYFGDDNYWETLFSIGLVPLFLAVVGALRHPDRRLVRGWLVLAGLAIWLACGRHLVLFALAYLTVPGMSWFRVPARALFLANVAGAVLAGLGVETLQKHMTAARDWHKLAVRFVGIVLLLLAGLFLILLVRGTDGSSRTAAAIRRVLTNGCFWLTLGGMTASILMGSLVAVATDPSSGRRIAGAPGAMRAGLVRVFAAPGGAGRAVSRRRSGRTGAHSPRSRFASIRPDSHQGPRLVLRRSSGGRAGHRKDEHHRRFSARPCRPALPAPLSRRVVSAPPTGRPDAGRPSTITGDKSARPCSTG